MFKHIPFLPVILFALLTWISATSLHAQGTAPEPPGGRILSYESDITVNPDSTLLVRETIKLYALGRLSKSRIYRDFPTRYRDRFGHRYAIHMEVLSLQRDGQPEEFYLRKLSNGLRLYLGEKGALVAPGEHTYELTSAVDRELGLFPNHDELYWNVTGNGWVFPIEQASATVHLPKGIVKEAIMPDAYTGFQGSVQTGYTASVDNQSNVNFRTTRALAPHEALTIVARWPNGFVHPPTDDQNHRYFLEDNQANLIGFAGLLVLLIYYTVAWFLAGRSRERHNREPPLAPPRGFSPAALRYAWRRKYDPKTLVANLIDLAVKKYLSIREDNSGGFVVERVNPHPQPAGARLSSTVGATTKASRDERLVLAKLFRVGERFDWSPRMALYSRVLRARFISIYGLVWRSSTSGSTAAT